MEESCKARLKLSVCFKTNSPKVHPSFCNDINILSQCSGRLNFIFNFYASCLTSWGQKNGGPGPSLYYLPDDAISSFIKLFTDDAVIYTTIETSVDHHTLQNDLKLLETWAFRRQMRFAPTKCHMLRITLKRNQSDFK